MNSRFLRLIVFTLAASIIAEYDTTSFAQQHCSVCESEFDSGSAPCDCCPQCDGANWGQASPQMRSPQYSPSQSNNVTPGTEMNLSDAGVQPLGGMPAPAAPGFEQTMQQGNSPVPAQSDFAMGSDLSAMGPQGGLDPGANSGQSLAEQFGSGSEFEGGENMNASAAPSATNNQLASGGNSAKAPNMIGDFLNGLTTGAGFTSRIAIDYEGQQNTQTYYGSGGAAQATGIFADADAARRARIINGFDGGTTGSVTVVTGLPGVLEPGDGGYFDSNDLEGSSSGIQPRVQGTIDSVNETGLTETFSTFTRTTIESELTATLDEPISQDALVDVVDEQLTLNEISLDELGDLADMVNIQYVQEESYYHNSLSVVTDDVGPDNVPDTTIVSEYEAIRFTYDISLILPSANPGEFIGRANFTDNNSPIPRDRVFFDYNFFHNARIGTAQIPMNRFTPGFEKTFMDGLMSFETRVPMAVTLDSTLTEGDDNVLAYEIGDLAFALKGLLYQDSKHALAVGTGVTVPTADDFNANLADGTTVLSIENRTVRVTPYIGALITPNDQFFLQGFLSADVAASGNRVSFDQAAFFGVFDDTNPTGSSLQNIGTLQSSTLVKFDVTAGKWLCRNRNHKRITDVAAVLEGHLVSAVGDSDVVSANDIAIGEGPQSTVFNITTGAHLYFGERDVLTLGYGVPVTEDRFFDGELRATWNRYF